MISLKGIAPAIPAHPDSDAQTLTALRQGIRTANHILAHTKDEEARVWLSEWLAVARAAVAKATGGKA